MTQRSKTPTADLHYSHMNFNTIYQPFIKNNPAPVPVADEAQFRYVEMQVELFRQESGFGFRIVGGEEEKCQVAVGFIVPGGAADVDGRLRPGDEIGLIDNENVIGASHKRVVNLMTIAGLNRRVKLTVRRKVPLEQKHSPPLSAGAGQVTNGGAKSDAGYPYTISIFRNGHEGFGFVIISTLNRNGPTIGEFLLGFLSFF